MVDSVRDVFHKKFIKYMELNKAKQSDIAHALNAPLTTVSGWYRGINFPRPDKMQMLADYFGINVEDLITDNSNDQKYSELRFALQGKLDKLTDEELEEMSILADLALKRRKSKND